MKTIVPYELQKKHQWVCWRYQLRNGTPTKIPIDVKRRSFASSTNPVTWTNFLAAQYAYSNKRRWLDGIGFVFTQQDIYYGVDLDHCINKDRRMTDIAEEIIYQCDSYTEISPSGRGVKVICKIAKGQSLPPTIIRPNGWPIEIYPHSRFFTITESHLEWTPLDITPNIYISELIERMLKERPDGSIVEPVTETEQMLDASEDVTEVITAIINSRANSKFLQYVEGSHAGHPSPSEADLALMNMLAFFTNNNIPLMIKIAHTTGLKRSKWNRIIKRSGLPYIQHVARLATSGGQTHHNA